MVSFSLPSDFEARNIPREKPQPHPIPLLAVSALESLGIRCLIAPTFPVRPSYSAFAAAGPTVDAIFPPEQCIPLILGWSVLLLGDAGWTGVDFGIEILLQTKPAFE